MSIIRKIYDFTSDCDFEVREIKLSPDLWAQVVSESIQLKLHPDPKYADPPGLIVIGDAKITK